VVIEVRCTQTPRDIKVAEDLGIEIEEGGITAVEETTTSKKTTIPQPR